MGKKRVIKQSANELIQESEKLEKALKKQIKVKKKVLGDTANVYIFSSYNNTIMTLTDLEGNTILQKSAGSVGFKGTKKGTPYAATRTATALCEIAKQIGIKKFHIFVKGIGSGRESALRVIASYGFDILSIRDITPIAHGGCQPPKPRRV